MEQQTHYLREGQDVEPAAVDGRLGSGGLRRLAYPRRRQRRLGRGGDVGILDIPVLKRKEKGGLNEIQSLDTDDERKASSKFHSPRNKVGLGTWQSHVG